MRRFEHDHPDAPADGDALADLDRNDVAELDAEPQAHRNLDAEP